MITYRKHVRNVMEGYELDFYFPEHKLAIEFNDNASHNSTRPYIEGKVLQIYNTGTKVYAWNKEE